MNFQDILKSVKLRNSVLTHFFLSDEFAFDDKRQLRDEMAKEGESLFPEFLLLWNEKGVVSREFLETVDFPHEVKEIGYTLAVKDIWRFYREELEYRKKRRFAQDIVDVTGNLNELSLHKFRERVLYCADKYISRREVEEDAVDLAGAYAVRKEMPLGVVTGVKSIDDATMGLSLGAMALVAAYVGDGKTTMCENIAYRALTNGFNVLFLTLEVPRVTVHNAMLSLHSIMTPEFASRPIEHTHIEKAKLDDEDVVRLFEKVKPSFDALPGKFLVLEHSDVEEYTYSNLRALCDSLTFSPHVVVVDYIQRVLPYLDSKGDFRAESRMVSDFWRLAVGDKHSPQRLVVLAAQTNREGWKRAKENGGAYDLTSLSDLNQLERDASYVITLYKDEEARASNQTKMCLLKNRLGKVFPSPLMVSTEHRCCMMGDLVQGYSENLDFVKMDASLGSGDFDVRDLL